uniref:Uncharacterized protein n=1 Tax=Cucumis melo TaxID=3656 RepID=A0A9I9E4G3_CUCME
MNFSPVFKFQRHDRADVVDKAGKHSDVGNHILRESDEVLFYCTIISDFLKLEQNKCVSCETYWRSSGCDSAKVHDGFLLTMPKTNRKFVISYDDLHLSLV